MPIEAPSNLTTTSEKLFHQYRTQQTKVAMYSKVLNGRPSGKPPLGYSLTRDGEIVLDPEVGKRIEYAFILVCTFRKSLRETLRIVTQAGLRTNTGKPLHHSTLHSMLTNPFYAGMIRYEGKLYPGKHLAVVSPELFERTREVLATKPHPSASTTSAGLNSS